MNKLYPLLYVLFLFISEQVFSQVNPKDSAISTSMVTASYSYQVPGNDLAKRFLPNNSIGAGYLYKTRKNWIFGADGFFMFRDTIKETNIFDSISTSDGNIIDGNGLYADFHLYERGFLMGVKCGKLFPVIEKYPNSGIILLGTLGFLQHKIRIENSDNAAPQIKGDYKKGYDRLTNGLAVSEFIGYMHMSDSRLFNFYAGFEFTQGWTQSRRSYNFDTMKKDLTKRMDVLYSFKIGWIIPLYKRMPESYYFN
ncbi:MAG TPA: hypothetical protein PKK00_05880 [Bacteroidales bacterium]|nr:hypothetical protein [Bacteroidales bacterium]HPS16839.1 hypothetical protein [Bacteroidales bacterium]